MKLPLENLLNEIELMLYDNYLIEIDIAPLVKKYQSEIDPQNIPYLRVTVKNALVKLKEDKNVVGIRNDVIATLVVRLAGEYEDKPIIIKSTYGFKEYYEQKSRSQIHIDNSVTQNTYGNNSPISSANHSSESNISSRNEITQTPEQKSPTWNWADVLKALVGLGAICALIKYIMEQYKS